MRIDQNVVYRLLAEDPANVYSLLLVAGYLKAPRKELQADGSYLCEVSIPNREIAAVYKSEILSHLLQIGAVTRTTANRESGDGRYDISLIPREKRYPGMIMELKWKKNLDEEKLAGLAEEAFAQIEEKGYEADMKEDGITNILKFGIVFSGKRVHVKTKQDCESIIKKA
ncbi:MAG: PD-(D/E)XK nuclease domain-containing protein [Lachnospiraceae bacterium]|nr:PD-(D/E)XK nuclease domain-containing protein [Lachnospiraceae bacterium]